MSTPSKDPNEKPKKPSFWEKLSERRDADSGDSLVSAIVRKAEKEASGGAKKGTSPAETPQPESDEKKQAHSRLANAKTLLTFVIIAALGVWIYFTAILGENNYYLSKFGKENLTVEFERKTELLQQTRTDIRDTQKFSKLLQVENLANRVLQIDLESPILNYERPEGEKVVAREGSTNVLIKTVNDDGEIVYLSEAEVTNLEKAKNVRVETTLAAIEEIIVQAENLTGTIKVNAAVEEQLAILIAEITSADLSTEENFPSAILKSHFAAAQSAASEILKNVKSENLKSLVSDIKKQANLIDTTALDQTTKEIVESIQKSLAGLSQQRPSSFETAYNEIRSLDISKISDNDIYQKIVQIVGDPRVENSSSDLATAAMITRNLGRINTINELRSNRIAWSTVIERAEKVVRLGADLTRDTDGTPMNATRDIDPNGVLVSLISYAGKSKNGDVEIRGDAFGKEDYTARTFSLLADIIDALEGSRYFKDVTGFSFSREEDRNGNLSSPLNFKLSLQDPATTDKRDVSLSAPKIEEEIIATDDEIVDTEDLQNLIFGNAADEMETTDENTEEIFATTEEIPESENPDDTEMTGVFDALGETLNN